MRRIALALILALVMALGCAWSRGRVRTWTPQSDGPPIVKDVHCWTIVFGKGRLGATCDDESAVLASEGTGIDDNLPLLMGAIAKGAAEGAKPKPGP